MVVPTMTTSNFPYQQMTVDQNEVVKRMSFAVIVMDSEAWKRHQCPAGDSVVSLQLPSTLLYKYKTHQISKLKCFLSRLAVAFAQSIEARCQVEKWWRCSWSSAPGVYYIRDLTANVAMRSDDQASPLGLNKIADIFRRHFQMHFLKRTFRRFDSFTEVYSWGSTIIQHCFIK